MTAQVQEDRSMLVGMAFRLHAPQEPVSSNPKKPLWFLHVCGTWERDIEKDFTETIELKYLFYTYIIYKELACVKSHVLRS